MLAISPEAGKALKPCVPRLGLPLKPSSAAPRCADAGSVLVQGIAAYCLVIGLLRNVKVECNGFIADFVGRHESSVTRSHLTQLAAACGGEQQTLPCSGTCGSCKPAFHCGFKFCKRILKLVRRSQ